MASKGQMTGMLGVYLTAVELVKRGFIVSPTSRSAMGADLLVTDQCCRKAWSVQVKTNASVANFWLTSPNTRHMASPSHIYVFVNVPKNLKNAPHFYIVPSHVVASTVRKTSPRSTGSVWHFYRRDNKYEDNWKVFGNPSGPSPGKKLA